MTIPSTGSGGQNVYNGQGVSQGNGTGSVDSPQIQPKPPEQSNGQVLADIFKDMFKPGNLLASLPKPQPLTGQQATETATAVTAMDPTEVVFDLFQLMALVLEAQMQSYELGSQRRSAAADAVNALRWAGAKLKDKSADAQFKASILKAGFEIAGAAVSMGGSAATFGLVSAANTQTVNAGVQGGSGFVTALGAIFSAMEQQGAGKADADAQRMEATAGGAEKGYGTSNEMMQRALELISKLQQFFQQVSQAEIQTNTHTASNV